MQVPDHDERYGLYKLKLFDLFVVREKYGFGRFRLSSLRASDVLGFPAIFAPPIFLLFGAAKYVLPSTRGAPFPHKQIVF